jgi:NADPH:quinone reductase-like Zn-dependent oxidoreductase
MKAIVAEQYGTPDVLKFAEVDKPAPKKNEVLIKIGAASLNAFDWHMLLPDPFMVRLMGGGLLKPKNRILGTDMAGQVEAIGESATQFKPGDEVYGDLARWGCGACAEYVCAPEEALAPKPNNMTFEQAAAAPMAALTALQGLRDKGHVREGQKVLVNGASGGVGTFAVQLAKFFGAEVTAVCSTGNVDKARSLGADHVIDYTKEDFTRSGRRYDLILAANGFHPLADYKRALARGGSYVMTGGSMKQIFHAMLLAPWYSMTGGKKLGGITAHANRKDLVFIKELMEAGKVVPVIDRVYPLAEVPEALRYLLAGHARGKVVIRIEDPASENKAGS